MTDNRFRTTTEFDDGFKPSAYVFTERQSDKSGTLSQTQIFSNAEPLQVRL
jgi:hypothetical protein